MKKPTLKEVQEHFKNVKEIKTFLRCEQKISSGFFEAYDNIFDFNGCKVWDNEKGYAEIITKKPGGQILDYPRKRLQVTVPLEIYDTCMSLVDAEILKFKSKQLWSRITKYLKESI